jgi:hypothetical protein
MHAPGEGRPSNQVGVVTRRIKPPKSNLNTAQAVLDQASTILVHFPASTDQSTLFPVLTYFRHNLLLPKE